jgi:nicotinate-nucleotide--dimethylbenzimidazole phosphoribosyltransferase
MTRAPSAAAIAAALDEKTKPPGSLGELEHLAATLARIQRTLKPSVDRPRIVVFAADHGIAARGVSAYPSAVTAQMVANFAGGGAAINVLARAAGAALEIVDVGVAADTRAAALVVQDKVALGSADFVVEAALTPAQRKHALAAGARAAERAQAQGCDLLAFGEMGIGNTSSAAALLCALTGQAPRLVVGVGTGIDPAQLTHKRRLIEAALARVGAIDDPLKLLAELGGFEIAAIVGALLKLKRAPLPIVIDGFIVTVAALVACRVAPSVRERLIFAHRSAERGHGIALAALNATPLLEWGLRLGEGSGAALAIPLCRAAARVLSEMASFASAGVSRE